MAATSKSAFNRLNSKLITAEPSEFQGLALRLIRFLAPWRLGTSTLAESCFLDGNLTVWNGNEEAELAVMCIALEGPERDLGQEKIEECVKSIEAFAKGRLRARVFLVVHNRPGGTERSPKGQSIRKQVDRALDSLKSSNQVKRVEHWNCRGLLAQLEKALKEKVIDFFERTRPETYGVSATNEILKVPLETQLRTVDRLRLKAVDDRQVLVADPAAELTLISSGLDARAVLLGHAGFGKTVAVNRAARGTRGPLILVRAADLTEDAANRNSLLAEFPTVDQLLVGLPEDEIPTFRPLVVAVMEGVLSMPGVAALLVIDGLDESRALSRPGGLVWLLNILKRYQLPVILTCRSEFWNARVADFEAAFGLASPRPGPMQRDTRLKIVALLEWDQAQILSLSERFRDCLSDVTERDRIQQFIHLVKEGQYAAIYRDIPKRPLFLQWILETIAELGVHQITVVQLLQEFVERKIKRDFVEPRRDGGPGRLSILERGEALTVTIDLAFCAMMRAARLMSSISSNGELELLPSCEIRKVLEAETSLLRIDDPTGLFLNSLLTPIAVKGLSTTVRFDHQVYQEFFLAKFIERHPEEFIDVTLPENVRQWIVEDNSLRTPTRKRSTENEALTDQQAEETYIVSLSGGGLRATLFHLGLFVVLHHAKKLKQIRGLTAVSGGSILAAHFAKHWKTAVQEGSDGFITVASSLISFARSDLRDAVLVPWLWSRLLPCWWMTRLGRSARLERAYETHFGETALGDLAPRPFVALIATDAIRQERVAFTPTDVLRFPVTAPTNLIAAPSSIVSKGVRLSLAVAASSCFPIVFPRMHLTHDELGLKYDEFKETLALNDGGVAGNLGIEVLLTLLPSLGSDKERVLLSDAERSQVTKPGDSFRADQQAQSAAQSEGARKQAETVLGDRFVSIRFSKRTDISPNRLSFRAQTQLGGFRTDLDAPTWQEIHALLLHGATVSAEALGLHESPTAEQEIQETIRAIICRVGGPGDQATPAEGDLAACGTRPKRRIVIHGILVILVGLLVLTGAASLMLWMATLVFPAHDKVGPSIVDPDQMPPLPSTMLSKVPVNTEEVPLLPKLNYDAFSFSTSELLVDLRQWVPFDPKDLRARTSPVISTRRVVGTKLQGVDEIRIYGATEGTGIDAECISGQPFRIEHAFTTGKPAVNLMHEYHVVVDISAVPTSTRFEVTIRMVTWNGMKEDDPWQAFVGFANMPECRIQVLFPAKRPYLRHCKTINYRDFALDRGWIS